MDDVQDARQKADRHLTMIATLYEADLELQRPSPTLRAKIRTFLDTEKLALDHLAEQVVAMCGAGGTEAHYPLAPDAGSVDAFLDRFMPGVRATRPDIAAVVGTHQPFAVPALARLRGLLVEEKRQQLTAKSRPAPEEAPPAAEEPPPTETAPPPPPPPPPPTGLGGGLTGSVFINGVEYDPNTLKPLHPPPPVRRETIYEDWLFAFDDGEMSALQTLQAIQVAVAGAITEISAAAVLPR